MAVRLGDATLADYQTGTVSNPAAPGASEGEGRPAGETLWPTKTAINPAGDTRLTVGAGNNNLVVTVPTISGFNYVLQSTTNLTPTIIWNDESTNAGTGVDLILNVPIEPGKPEKFLRFWVY
jgi:hypothetical protein